MIYDFTYQNPTKIHFGKTALEHLPEELNNFGSNILLVYGKNSIKATGLYDKIMEMLKTAGKKVTELAGINSNPRYSQVMEGCRLVRENNIDLILAVGGGSVVDCSKALLHRHTMKVMLGVITGSSRDLLKTRLCLWLRC